MRGRLLLVFLISHSAHLESIQPTVSRSNATARPSNVLHTKNLFWEIICIGMKCALFIVGCVGNCLVLITIYQNTRMHNMQNYFLLNLTVTDLINLVVLLPYSIMMRYVSWPFGEFVCKYILPIAECIPAVSILTLVVMYLDRYRVIVHSPPKPLPKRCGIIVIVFLWVATYLIIGLPLSFVFLVGDNPWVEKMCQPSWKNKSWKHVYFMSRVVLFYVLPSFTIFYCYIRVRVSLHRNINILQTSISGLMQVKWLKDQKRITVMFFVIFILLLVCFFPLALVTFLRLHSTQFVRWEYVGEAVVVAQILLFANSVCNPIVLYMMSHTYRNHFEKLLSCLKQDHQSSAVASSPDGGNMGNRRRSTNYSLFEFANKKFDFYEAWKRRRSTNQTLLNEYDMAERVDNDDVRLIDGLELKCIGEDIH